MNYIYDILLNYKEEYYDFYDWNKNDNMEHIRKIPIFRVCTDDLFNIVNNKVKIDPLFLEKIYNKTELFIKNGVKKIKYACLLSDGDLIIGINIINKKIKLSSLLIDEELDSLEDVYKMDILDIKYIIQGKNNYNWFKTRNQNEKNKFLIKEINKIIDDKEKLKYLYYDCFDYKEEDVDKIVKELMNIKDDKIVNKVYDFLKLLEFNK